MGKKYGTGCMREAVRASAKKSKSTSLGTLQELTPNTVCDVTQVGIYVRFHQYSGAWKWIKVGNGFIQEWD